MGKWSNLVPKAPKQGIGDGRSEPGRSQFDKATSIPAFVQPA